MMMSANDIELYNDILLDSDKDICMVLMQIIDHHLSYTTSKIRHGHPVRFINDNPIVGYDKLKDSVRLLFWSGQSFEEDGLAVDGSFKAASKRYYSSKDINKDDIIRRLQKAQDIQRDYKNIVKRKGVLEQLIPFTINPLIIMQSLNFTITIDAPVAIVRDTMLNHPTYEQRTTAFCEGSTYTGSWDQGADITFADGTGQGMIATIAENRIHEYVSIHHLGEIMNDPETGKLTTKMFEGAGHENYRFTAIDDNTTQVDVELTSLPEEYVSMMSEMRPKALDILKTLSINN